MKYTDRGLGTTCAAKGSRYSTAQRNAGRAARQLACDQTAARILEGIFLELLPVCYTLKKEVYAEN